MTYSKDNKSKKRKIKEYKTNTRFANALNYILKHENLLQKDIIEMLNKENGFEHVDYSHLVSWTTQEPVRDSNVIKVFNKLFNINEDYLRGTSNAMFNKGAVDYENFSKVFPNFKAYKYDCHEIHETFLHVDFNRSTNDFLINIDKINLLKEEGLIDITEEYIKRLEQEYTRNSSKSHEETRAYALVPIDLLDKLFIIGVRNLQNSQESFPLIGIPSPTLNTLPPKRIKLPID